VVSFSSLVGGRYDYFKTVEEQNRGGAANPYLPGKPMLKWRWVDKEFVGIDTRTICYCYGLQNFITARRNARIASAVLAVAIPCV